MAKVHPPPGTPVVQIGVPDPVVYDYGRTWSVVWRAATAITGIMVLMCTLTGSMAQGGPVCAGGRVSVDSRGGLIVALRVISDTVFIWT